MPLPIDLAADLGRRGLDQRLWDGILGVSGARCERAPPEGAYEQREKGDPARGA
ncbi:MAG: hypothetical protein Q8P18_33080 [Pseudomonadota bacterium]|nr:hypothetical protein [Pseudomonadota bacterium]